MKTTRNKHSCMMIINCRIEYIAEYVKLMNQLAN